MCILRHVDGGWNGVAVNGWEQAETEFWWPDGNNGIGVGTWVHLAWRGSKILGAASARKAGQFHFLAIDDVSIIIHY